MAESHGDGSIAPRRSLNGPILPPPPPELAEKDARREADEAASRRAAAQRQAEKETRQAEKDAKRQAAAKDAAEKAEQKAAPTDARAGSVSPDTSVPKQGKGLRGLVSRETGSSDSSSTSKLPRMGMGAAPGPETSLGGAPAQSSSSQKKSRGSVRRTRRAHLRLVQVDAWSVMKTAFLLSIALGIVLVVAVSIIWSVLGAAGVWESINSIVQQSVGSDNGTPFDIEQYIGASRVLGFTMIVAVVDVVLITAIATLGAFLYNLSAALLGGIEVTLAEDA